MSTYASASLNSVHDPAASPNPATTSSTEPDPTFAVVARGVSMTYVTKTQRFQALKAVDLDVRKGSVHMVMGPAGAGKTTLLLIMAKLLTPTAGSIQLLGHDITNMSRQQLTEFRLQHVGIIFQENNLLRSLTAIENVEVALHLRRILGDTARRQAKQLLESVGLGDKTNHLPRQLSGGQQQRVAIARGLAGNPPIIIADEPTAALDSENGHLVAELLHRRAKECGCTVLIATHDHRITQFADEITYIEDGTIGDRQDNPLLVH